MNLEDLIRRFRNLGDDRVEPYLWADEDVTDWLNDAQAQACIRGRLLREDQNAQVCQIALQQGKHTYPLHASLYEIINLRIKGPDGGCARDVQLVSREWLDASYPRWRDEDRPCTMAVQDDTTIRMVGGLMAGEALHLECYRLPLKAMVNDMDKPEIHVAHHEHLIQWALHKAFGVPDAETFDPTRAQIAEAAFTAHFGLHPGGDLRRSTRQDVPHHIRGHLI